MPSLLTFLAFGLIALGMVLTPGPNMIYVVSRSICQGRNAGLISLGGVGIGFIVWLLLAAFGITAVVVAVPFAYGALKLAGAGYLAWLAWQALKPGGSSPFAVRTLPPDSPRKLFAMGLVTNLLNPKAAVLYLSLLPQFIDRSKGHVLEQSLALGGGADRHQPDGQFADLLRCRIHRRLPRRPAGLGPCSTLADGRRSGRAGDAHGVRARALTGMSAPAP